MILSTSVQVPFPPISILKEFQIHRIVDSPQNVELSSLYNQFWFSYKNFQETHST